MPKHEIEITVKGLTEDEKERLKEVVGKEIRRIKYRRYKMGKVFYLCDGEKEDCKKMTCYKSGGDCRHTSDINHASNFERKGRYKNGSFYEKEDVSRNETSSTD